MRHMMQHMNYVHDTDTDAVTDIFFIARTYSPAIPSNLELRPIDYSAYTDTLFITYKTYNSLTYNL